MFDDCDIISSFTTQDGLNDGTFIKASPTHPNWVFTRAVFNKIMDLLELKDVKPYSQKYLQRVVPLLMDVANVCRTPEAKNDKLYTGDQLDGNLTGKQLWFAMNDLPGGGITIMFPEDY